MKDFNLKICKNASAFLEVAEPEFLKNEALHNLVYGTAFWARQKNVLLTDQKIFALITRGDTTMAAIMWTKPYPLVFSAFRQLNPDDIHEIENLLTKHALYPERFSGEKTATEFLFLPQRAPVTEQIIMSLADFKPLKSRGDCILKPAGESDVSWLTDWLIQFYSEALPQESFSRQFIQTNLATQKGKYFILYDGPTPLSMAAIVRETKSFLVLGGVFTPMHLRNHGYSQRCMSQVCSLITGKMHKNAALHADKNNPVSCHMYEKLGFRTVGTFVEYRRSLTPPNLSQSLKTSRT